MTQVQRRTVRGAAMVAGLVVSTALVGCGNFFVCDKASCTGNGGGTTGPAGNVAYVADNVSASTTINGYTLGTKLTATTKSPYGIDLTPAAMVISHKNGFLYVASSAQPAGIYGFSIGTGGLLSVLNGGAAFVNPTSVAAMDVSPDGQWLIVSTAYGTGLIAGATIQAYPLNPTTGEIGPVTTSSPLPVPYSSPDGTPVVSALKVAPSGQFIAVALGTGGVVPFGFDTSSGLITVGNNNIIGFNPKGTAGGYDVAIDSNNLLYVAATSAVFVYQVQVPANGIPTSTVITNGIAIGSTGPWSIALDGSSYVYAGATGTPAAGGTATNLIYGFSNKSGALTALPPPSATIAAPAGTTKIAVDSTGAFLLADGYNSTAGLQLYSITSATGVLTSLDTAPTGVAASGSLNVPAALALSH